MLDGQQIIRPHKYDCEKNGPCMNPSCGYEAGHPELRAKQKERVKVAKQQAKLIKDNNTAAIAGMNPPKNNQVDVLLSQAGLNK